MIIEVILFVIFCLTVWYYLTRLPDNYPPTPPIRLPLIGHGLYMLGYEHAQIAFHELCDKVSDFKSNSFNVVAV